MEIIKKDRYFEVIEEIPATQIVKKMTLYSAEKDVARLEEELTEASKILADMKKL